MIAGSRYKTGARRVLAALIDGILFTPLLLADYFMQEHENLSDAVYLAWFFLSSQLYWIYSVTCHAQWGQTIGKRCVGVKLVRNADEKSIGWKEAFLRDSVIIVLVVFSIVVEGYYWYLYYTGQFTDAHDGEYEQVTSAVARIQFFWVLVEFGTMLTNAKRRAVHDFIAGTVVVRKFGY